MYFIGLAYRSIARQKVTIKKSPEGLSFIFDHGTVLDLLHAREVSLLNLRFNSAQFPRYPDLFHSVRPQIRCLGFAPRSGSFAFEPAVQLRSIPSLSGLVSLRPSANPLSRIYDLILCKIRLLDYWRSQGLELHSEFYSKNSAFHKPCSHRHWGLTQNLFVLCKSPYRNTIT